MKRSVFFVMAVGLICSGLPDQGSAESDWKSLHGAGLRAYQEGHWGEAEAKWRAALQAAQGEASPADQASTLRNLAELYVAQRRPDDAIKAHEEIVALYEEHLPPDDSRLIKSLKTLASSYDEAGRYEEAERLLRRAAQAGSAAKPTERALALQDLALHYENRGDLDAAEGAFRDALAALDPIRSREEGEFLASGMRMALARVELERGALGNAERWLAEELQELDGSAGWDRSSRADALGLYAELLRRTGRHEEAAAADAERLRLLGSAPNE